MISADRFPVEDLDLDRLIANLLEIDDAVAALTLTRDSLPEGHPDRPGLERRIADEHDRRRLTEQLIERKRNA